MKRLKAMPAFPKLADSFPWELCYSLDEIDFSNCGFTHFPIGLALIPNPDNVKSFTSDGNPLQGPSLHLASSSFVNLIDALKEIREGKVEKCKSTKLMVVGDAGVGKTCLLDAIHGKPFAATYSTDGIDLGEAELGDIRFSCWDFAGQVRI